MTDPSDITTVALDVGAMLDRLGVAWVIGGSLASSIHGEPRSTQDVDFVAALSLQHVNPLIAALEPAYYADADAMREAITTSTSFNAIHVTAGFKVDVFVAGDDAFEAER